MAHIQPTKWRKEVRGKVGSGWQPHSHAQVKVGAILELRAYKLSIMVDAG